MKKILCLLCCLLLMTSVTALAESAPDPDMTEENTGMTITSAGIVDGVMDDAYGARGKQKKGSTPTFSLPITIENAPEGTVCFALIMDDPDAKPLAGYVWVHWMVVNFTDTELGENASIDLAETLIQGKNDFKAVGYGGPTPPDKPHTYVITVYALDSELALENGFTKKEFEEALEGHIIETAVLEGVYNK